MRILTSKFFSLLLLFIFLSACARTPVPISDERILQSIEADLANLKYEDSIESIDLYKAISLAIRNNRDLRVEVMNSALQQRQNNLLKFDMLPDLAANAGYSEYTRYQPSTSVTSINDTSPEALSDPTYTVGAEKWQTTRDIEFTWNALDFGLSYIRAGQQANRYLIAKELERKSIQNITRDVIRAYWNAKAAENLLQKLSPLLVKVEIALKDSKYIEELTLSAPVDALLYQKELLDIQRTLQTQKRALINSKTELATLMGLLPSEGFQLIDTLKPLATIDLSVTEMEEVALFSRPELMESRYLKRISNKEAKASMVSLLPGLKFNAAYAYNSNKYLMNQDSTQYGVSIGANLLNVFSAPSVKKANDANNQLATEQHLAISMTILSQVHLASINYSLAIEEYDTAQRYLDVATKISDQVQNAQKISRFGELEVIREEASLLVAELRRDLAYTEMQYSIGQIYASVGKDILPDNFENMGLNQLAIEIQDSFIRWSEKYIAYVNKPLSLQNPTLKVLYNPEATALRTFSSDAFTQNQFQIAKDTFIITGPGTIRYEVLQENGDDLPGWLAFLSSDLVLAGLPPQDVEEINLKMSISNAVVSTEDYFSLKIIDEVNEARLVEAARRSKELEKAKQINKSIKEYNDAVKINQMMLDLRNEKAIEKAAKINSDTIAFRKIVEENLVKEELRIAEEELRIAEEELRLAEEEELQENENEEVLVNQEVQAPNENFIQIAAFKNLDKASKVANAVMKAIGENVLVKETESSDPVFHRILVGPFEANMEAAVVDKITSIGIKEFFKTIE
ncbi:TolC family protein [Pelagibacterales bacterium]|nr:TolC family protein [Pelagibacterales bacterium]